MYFMENTERTRFLETFHDSCFPEEYMETVKSRAGEHRRQRDPWKWTPFVHSENGLQCSECGGIIHARGEGGPS